MHIENDRNARLYVRGTLKEPLTTSGLDLFKVSSMFRVRLLFAMTAGPGHTYGYEGESSYLATTKLTMVLQ
jgi:hypothetical protein